MAAAQNVRRRRVGDIEGELLGERRRCFLEMAAERGGELKASGADERRFRCCC